MTAATPSSLTTTEKRASGELMRVSNLVKDFPLRRGLLTRSGRNANLRAVNNVSFALTASSTLGIVGESGSGKSTLARLVMRLIEPTSGQLVFDGKDLLSHSRREMHHVRRRIQLVFQDPLSTLDPRMAIRTAIGQPLVVHGLATGRAKTDRVVELLELVGLSASDLRKYPHQFSGGQAQRIGIARALATNPDILICDEAVSALDVSTQAQILNLLKHLQRTLGLSYLFIAHDLNVVRYMSDHICVMHLGEVVEQGPSETLFADPKHPYTESLLAAIPSPDPRQNRRHDGLVTGDPPSPSDPPSGCPFHTRCAHAFERCSVERPSAQEVAPGRHAACHLLDKPEVRR